MRSSDLKQGDLENIIINALWELESAQEQVFVADLQTHIKSEDRQWAYTTVKTVVDRLVEKGMAQRFKVGKKFYYASQVSRETAAVDALKKVTQQYFRNDLDELQAVVSQLRSEGFGIAAAPAEARKELERAFNVPSLSVASV